MYTNIPNGGKPPRDNGLAIMVGLVAGAFGFGWFIHKLMEWFICNMF